MIERLAILADDLTGAADTGAAFAAAGLRTVVLLSPDAPIPTDAAVLVLSSETRALLPQQAIAATRRCAARIDAWRGGDATVRVYKKIDSTMRGHPSLELATLMDALGETAALIAPAFPAQGRTTVDGHQCIDGVPLEHTSFGRDGVISDLATRFGSCARGPVTHLSIDDVHRGVDHVTARLADARKGMWIADAAADAALAILAAASLASPLRVLCGSAGLARAIATAHHQGRGQTAPQGARARAQGPAPVLVVAGSRHAATAAQVDALERDGVLVARPDRALLEHGDAAHGVSVADHACMALGSGQPVVIATTGTADVPVDGPVIAARLASIVARVCERVGVAGLVLTGGDTATAVCLALGVESLWLTGELQPGVATGTLIGGRHPGLPVVTKAGGFGDAGALTDAAAFVGSCAAGPRA